VLHSLPWILLCIALVLVSFEVSNHPPSQLWAAFSNIPALFILCALGFTILAYLILACYDLLALRYTGHHLTLRQALLASLIGYAFSNNTGHAWATGGSVRYRFYTAWGIPGWDVLKISLFLGVSYILGVLTLGFVGTLLMPEDMLSRIERPEIIHILMILSAASLVFYWGLIILRRNRPFTFRQNRIVLPSPSITFGQTIVSCLDLLVAALPLWFFLPEFVDLPFGIFIVTFVVAQVAGLLSQVPGGIGVFEASFLWLAAPTLTPEHKIALLVALMLYRCVYFFLPLIFAAITLVVYEIRTRHVSVGDALKSVKSDILHD
jgi:phosphatidylglycerol lysyltransferase